VVAWPTAPGAGGACDVHAELEVVNKLRELGLAGTFLAQVTRGFRPNDIQESTNLRAFARSAQKIRREESGHEYADRTLIAWGARPPMAGEKPAAWPAAALDEVNARRLRHPGNHRYLFRLGISRERTRTVIAPHPRHYPKNNPARPAIVHGQSGLFQEAA
jgi:hypothetical protein